MGRRPVRRICATSRLGATRPDADDEGVTFVQTFVLENPWPLGIAFGIAALMAFLFGARRADKRLRIAAAVLAAIGIGLIATGYAVTTKREQIQNRSLALLDAAAPFNGATFAEFFEPDATVKAGSSVQSITQAIAHLERVHSSYRFKSHAIDRLAIRKDLGDEVIVEFVVITHIDHAMSRNTTAWNIFWRKGDDGVWRIAQMDCTRFNGHAPPGLPG